jgi:hypothetical protein
MVRASGAAKGSVYPFLPHGKQQLTSEALAVHSSRVMAFIEAEKWLAAIADQNPRWRG